MFFGVSSVYILCSGQGPLFTHEMQKYGHTTAWPSRMAHFKNTNFYKQPWLQQMSTVKFVFKFTLLPHGAGTNSGNKINDFVLGYE